MAKKETRPAAQVEEAAPPAEQAGEAAPVVIPPGYRENSQEHLVPERLIKAQDLERDELVTRLAGAAVGLSESLVAFREDAIGSVDAFVERLAKEYGTTMRNEDRGNITLSSFDGRTRIQVRVAEYLEFGEQIAVAKKLVGECLDRWGKNAPQKLRQLANSILKVDKNGQIDQRKLLQLRSLDMGDDKQWSEAMRALSDSIRMRRTRRYVVVQRRSRDGKYEQVPLSLSSL